MKRQELVLKLGIVAPALSTNDMVPILTHVCFNGDELFAYNEQIGISVPCKTDFEGAVPGNTLLNLLQASRAKDLEMTAKDGVLIIKAASAKLKLPLLPPERFVWKPPTLSDANVGIGVNTEAFKAALRACMRSVSIDTSMPDQLGITLIAADKDLCMYSTDSVTFSHARVQLKGKTKFDRVILSGTFCQQLLALAEKDKPLHLEVNKDHALMSNSGGVILFGALIHSPKPLDLAGIISEHYTDKDHKGAVDIPTQLELVLDRACIVSATNGEPVKTEIEVTKGVARFFTAAKTTECSDSVQVEDRHPAVTLAVNAKLVRNGYGDYDKMLITKDAFIMAGKNNEKVYMVAAN